MRIFVNNSKSKLIFKKEEGWNFATIQKKVGESLPEKMENINNLYKRR